MSNRKVRELLGALHDELQSTALDEATRDSLSALDAEIGQLLANSNAGQPTDAIARARQLETRFAIDHPAAERFIREMIDALGRMGV